VSVLYIGVVTYIVGEFSALFGCALGIPDPVTAISFVAMGTSLPDTFASRQAALEAPDADAAIGNVTGSSSLAASSLDMTFGCKEAHHLLGFNADCSVRCERIVWPLLPAVKLHLVKNIGELGKDIGLGT
jgi:hypothetical protein